MQINNKPMKTYRHIASLITAVIFFIAGIVFLGLGIYFWITNKPDENGNSNSIVYILFIVMGVIAIAVSIFEFIRTKKAIQRNKPLSEEEVKANIEKLNEGAPKIANLKDVKLFMRHGGKLNQSYFIENREGEVIYECVLKKFNPIGADTFEFNDKLNNYTKTVKIGKTMTVQSNTVMTSSYFKIDGVNCWDYLRNIGYEIKDYAFKKSLNSMELYKSGNMLANIVTCDKNDPWNESSKNVFHMGMGYFRLEINDCKLEDVVMSAIILSKVNLIE